MRSIVDYVVPWVRDAKEYGDSHIEFAWKHPEIQRMMSNENPLSPSDAVIKAVVEMTRQGNLYPDTGLTLRQKLGERIGLKAENVILGNGSTNVIDIILRTFVTTGDEVVIPVPTFSMYETRTRVNGGVPIMVDLTKDFYWDIEGIIGAISDKTRLIFICTPNNPIGNEIKESDLQRILELGLPTVVDEAYYELEEDPRTFAEFIPEFSNLIVMRTFSKAFGLAGLRVGYAYADTSVVSYLMRTKIPWNVSLISLTAALAALEDQEDLRQKQDMIILGRSYLCEQIERMPGLRAFPSEGNFVLIDASSLGKTSREIVDDLIAQGVFIRPMSSHRMKQGFVRVSVGTPQQNKQFIQLLRQYIEELSNGA